MMGVKTCFAVFLTLLTSSFGQSPVPERRLLTAADFKGSPDLKENYLARTYTVISIQYGIASACADERGVRLKAQTGISVGEKSWMKFKQIRSRDLLDELLHHEQGHYDIGQIFAIDLKTRLSNHCFDKSNYKKQADSIFRSMNQYYDTIQRRYDEETDYMRDRSKQSQWKQKIAAMRQRVIRAAG